MILDTFTRSYIECALWCTMDDDGNPLDQNYTISNISPSTLKEMIEDCQQFQEDHWDDIVNDLERAGMDFWLTRNRHGAGFWDGDWPGDVGKRLTNACRSYGSYDLYVYEGRIVS